MHRIFRHSFFLVVVLSAFACKKSDKPAPVNPPVDNSSVIRGADMSWLTQMENEGKKFYSATGTESDCIQILKDLGTSAVRIRVWVNPADQWNSVTDVVSKAMRAKNLGMKILIDFHYSDTWADPGHQTKPAAWASQDFTTLKQSLADHTSAILNALKASGVTPTWVQIGNETNDGMLWPDGQASKNMSQFAQLVSAGYTATKAVDPSIKVIVHISNGYDNSLFRWVFDGLKTNGAQWDIIGMSLYPTSSNWSTLNTQCLANMNDLVSRYDKDVMLVEAGMSWDQAAAGNSFLSDMISKLKSIPNGRGLGIFYWEPEAYNNWQGYTLGAFDNSGKPTIALAAFK